MPLGPLLAASTRRDWIALRASGLEKNRMSDMHEREIDWYRNNGREAHRELFRLSLEMGIDHMRHCISSGPMGLHAARSYQGIAEQDRRILLAMGDLNVPEIPELEAKTDAEQ